MTEHYAQNGAITTYQFQCTPGTDSTDCGFPEPFTYVKEGTSSIKYAFALESAYVFGFPSTTTQNKLD